ncbi:UNVERIFIED_CONTAM: hypothetical protein LBW93_03785 [Wolbachia endosymbiont of Nasonia longicornis]
MHANIETCTPFLVIRVADTGIQLSYFTTFFVRKDWIPVSSTGMTPFVVIVFPKVNDKGIIKYLSYNGI